MKAIEREAAKKAGALLREMGFIPANEIAQKAHYSLRRVQELAVEMDMPRAEFFGKLWLHPMRFKFARKRAPKGAKS